MKIAKVFFFFIVLKANDCLGSFHEGKVNPEKNLKNYVKETFPEKLEQKAFLSAVKQLRDGKEIEAAVKAFGHVLHKNEEEALEAFEASMRQLDYNGTWGVSINKMLPDWWQDVINRIMQGLPKFGSRSTTSTAVNSGATILDVAAESVKATTYPVYDALKMMQVGHSIEEAAASIVDRTDTPIPINAVEEFLAFASGTAGSIADAVDLNALEDPQKYSEFILSFIYTLSRIFPVNKTALAELFGRNISRSDEGIVWGHEYLNMKTLEAQAVAQHSLMKAMDMINSGTPIQDAAKVFSETVNLDGSKELVEQFLTSAREINGTFNFNVTSQDIKSLFFPFSWLNTLWTKFESIFTTTTTTTAATTAATTASSSSSSSTAATTASSSSSSSTAAP